jgi:hypothetical protein
VLHLSNKKILFIPSNRNHVDIFYDISNNFKKNYDVLYISQESYKNEDAEQKLVELNLNFKRFEDYKKKDPKRKI